MNIYSNRLTGLRSNSLKKAWLYLPLVDKHVHADFMITYSVKSGFWLQISMFITCDNTGRDLKR